MVRAALLYTLLFLVLLAPNPSLWRDHYIGSIDDVYQNAWNLWWFREAVTSWSSPYFTELLYAPRGVSLVTHPLQPTQATIALLLSPWLNLVEQYNLLLFISFIATGVLSCDIARLCNLSPIFALLAGYLVSFSQFHVLHGTGHLELTSMHWLLLPVSLALRARRTSVYTILAAVALIPLAFSSLYYLFFFGLFTAQLMFWALLKGDRRGMMILLPIISSTILLSIALGVPMALEAWKDPFFRSHFPMMGSLDLATFFVPGQMSYWSELTQWYWQDNGRYQDDHSVTFGVSVLVSLYVFFRERAWISFPYIAVGVIVSIPFFLISLGPVVTFFYNELPIPSLYQALNIIFPFSSLSGLPGRFIVVPAITLPLVVASAAQVLWNKKSHRIPMVLLVLLQLTELLPRRYETKAGEPAEYAKWLRDQPEEGIVLDLTAPLAEPMHQQTHHRHPLALGYTAREPRSAALHREAIVSKWEKRDSQGLCSQGVRFVIVPASQVKERAVLRVCEDSSRVRDTDLD